MDSRRAVVHGVVQGVGFRWRCAEEARRLGVKGWCRNRWDGTVEVHLEGDPAAVQELVDWLHRGPRSAVVSRVEVEETAAGGFVGFDVEP